MTRDYLTLFANKIKLTPIIFDREISCVTYLENELERFGAFIMPDNKELYINKDNNCVYLMEYAEDGDIKHIGIEIERITFWGGVIDLVVFNGGVSIALEDLTIGYTK